MAAHSLYERANPYELHLPHGHIDLKATRFEAAGDRAVSQADVAGRVAPEHDDAGVRR